MPSLISSYTRTGKDLNFCRKWQDDMFRDIGPAISESIEPYSHTENIWKQNTGFLGCGQNAGKQLALPLWLAASLGLVSCQWWAAALRSLGPNSPPESHAQLGSPTDSANNCLVTGLMNNIQQHSQGRAWQ